MSNLRYEIGTKFMVEFEIVDLDDDSNPYYLWSSVKDSESDPIISKWVSGTNLDELLSVGNPDIKRKRIEAEIIKLQEQLANIK
jgi:hypothetical protein